MASNIQHRRPTTPSSKDSAQKRRPPANSIAEIQAFARFLATHEEEAWNGELVSFGARVRGRTVTIWKHRVIPGRTIRRNVAQLRYDPSDAAWTLWWHDGWSWNRVDGVEPASQLAPLLSAVYENRRPMFWGFRKQKDRHLDPLLVVTETLGKR